MYKLTLGRVALVSALAALLALLMAVPAGASHEDDPRTKNLHPLGHIEEPRSLLSVVGNADVHTDIAFWGQYAFQGSWLGFNIRDISAPGNPKHITSVSCTGPQGDVVVWESILVRSWDGGFDAGAPPGAMCGGQPVPEGFAGLHIFDISDVTAPVLVGSVELSFQVPENEGRSCGSHTATGVPDPANNRLLIYNGPSTFQCEWFDIVEIPLDEPENAAFVRRVETGRPCHDNGVILGDAMLAACAGGNGFTVFTLDPAEGGALNDPEFLLSVDVNDDIDDGGVVDTGHSAAFTWDGEVLIFGHEPGGGVQARCRAEDPDSLKSAFFYEARTGEFLGMWTIPRPQSEIENCTFHNYNIVPLRSGNYVMVSGSYQSGVSVVDFTDPANAVEVAWSDPPPLGTVPGSPFCDGLECEIGGSWSAYWYNGLIYDTSITKGLNIFRFSGKETAGAMRLPHLNPQTQEFTIP